MSTWNMEWLNQNAHRAFPFKEDSSRTSTAGVRLPDVLLVDLMISVAATHTSELYVSRLLYAGGTMEFSVSTSGGDKVAGFSVSLPGHSTNKAYSMVGAGNYTETTGIAVLGDLSEIASLLPQGDHIFEPEATPLEARAVRTDVKNVQSLRVAKADGSTTAKIFGDVTLQAGSNIKLTPTSGGGVTSIRIDSLALDSELEEPCECDATQVKPDPIRSINGVTADVNGNIVLEPMDECIEIEGSGNSLKITDRCSKPCCGCPELEFLTQQLTIMKTTMAALEARASQLQTAELDFYNRVLTTIK